MTMNEERTTQVGTRKTYNKTGEREQKMLSFRCDFENLEWLNQQANKGRVINNLIAQARQSETGGD